MKKLLIFILSITLAFSFTLITQADTEDSGLPTLQTPSLSVKQSSVPTVKAGSENNILSVDIVNSTFSIAYDVTVRVSCSDNNIVIASNAYTMTAGAISPFGTTTISIPYSVALAATSGTYTFNIEITCISGDISSIQSHTFPCTASIRVQQLDKVAAPVITDISFADKNTVAGHENTLTLTVKNPNNAALYNLFVGIEGCKNGTVECENADTIPVLAANTSKTISIVFKTYQTTTAQLYDFAVSVGCSDVLGNALTASKGAYFVVSASSEFTETSPKVVVDSYALSPSGAQPGDTATLKIVLSNIGVIDAENLKISLGGYDATFVTVREVTSQKELGILGHNGKVSVEYSIALSKIFPQDVAVPLALSLSYSDFADNYYSDTANITLKSKTPAGSSSTTPAYKTPKIIIESFTTSSEEINAGTEFTLTFILRNTSDEFDVENITILMNSAESGTACIFTPVTASYSFFIEKIKAAGTYELSISLLPKISADSNIYPISFSIDYEYLVTENGASKYTPGSGKETLSVKVLQPINIELSNVYIPSTVTEGEMFNVSFTYNNKSRSNLYFMNVSLDGDVAFTDGKQELGSIPSGYSDSIDAVATVNGGPGEYTFNIVFNFKDAMNKETEIKYPYTITVEAAPVYDSGSEDMPVVDVNPVDVGTDTSGNLIFGMPIWVFFSILGVVVAAAVIIIVIIVKKRKALSNGAGDDEAV